LQKLIQECLKQLATKKQQQVGNITQIEDAAEKLKAHAESSKTWLVGKFTELRLLLDEEEVLAKKFIDKNTQLTLQVFREQAESCEKQIDVLNDLSNRVWSISQEPNPVQLLQAYTATEQEVQRQMHLGELCHPVPLSFEPVKSFFKGLVEAMQSTLQTPLDARLKENMDCQLSGSSSAKPGTLLKTNSSPERSLFLKYGQRSRLRPHDDPDRLGVFLDYEAGVLAFYDVTGGMSHLHTFRAAFQEPLYPALRLWEGAISIPHLP
ncbi:PREDICTED: tripartite motif-containing protein 14, partial [Galeopterus variegatus]|uniref:Tripartite motif-containing protein 14 n=1 Tax=Galeopterus variegatus TaxID=482537 RepID=A0ABM0QSB3_GALVR